MKKIEGFIVLVNEAPATFFEYKVVISFFLSFFLSDIMLHPHFSNYWKQDSYFKHYYNYQEQKAEETEKAEEERSIVTYMKKKLLKELVTKHGPKITKRGTIIEKDGWETVL